MNSLSPALRANLSFAANMNKIKLSGIYQPDEGEIFSDGRKISITSPKDAFSYGIGMIHQHYHLVDVFTAAQNIILGLSEEKMDIKNTNDKVKEITVELTKTTDTKLNEIGKSLMREYSRQLKNSKRAKN